MPIGSDPNETCPVILGTDKDKPDPKPTFRVRFLTDRELRKATALRRAAVEADKAGNEQEADAKLAELFTLCLAGWSGVTHRGREMAHGKDEPADFLSSFEVWELANQCLMAPQITESDRRNFASPSAPDGARSAGAPAAESATTHPAPTLLSV